MSMGRRSTKIIVVVKRSSWTLAQHHRDAQRMQILAKRKDLTMRSVLSSHEEHQRTIEEMKAALPFLDADVEIHLGAGCQFDPRGADLVVTLGGDGTLLRASHSVASVPILGINSAPSHSVGFFCGAQAGGVRAAIQRALAGRMASQELTRMQVMVNRKVVTRRVLNEALFCHASPAATTRYMVEVDGWQEEHKSSGFWIGPAAGSTAAQQSAGGRRLPLKSQQLQFVAREPYTPQGESYRMVQRLFGPEERLLVRSKMREGRLFFDGPDQFVQVAFGDSLVFQRSAESVRILGLKRHR
jgi:NAD+ kinase